MAEYIERNALIAEFKRLMLGENSLVERLFADGVYAVIETSPPPTWWRWCDVESADMRKIAWCCGAPSMNKRSAG